MKISTQQKKLIQQTIVDDLLRRQEQDRGYSQVQHANFLDINVSQYNRVHNGELDRVLSDSEWVRVGKRLYVDINNVGWKTATTNVYKYIREQLENCHEKSLSALNMDMVGIGKTHAAEEYASRHANVVYIKCRTGITRANLIRLLAQGLGLSSDGRIDTIRDKVEIHMTGLDCPLIILDDAGYMNDNCWMEIKGLYDALEYECGWYIIGDTSLKKKVKKLLEKDRVGWAALFDRFNQKFQAYMADKPEAEVVSLKREMLELILKANMPSITKSEAQEIVNNAKLSLRALRKEINKRRTPNSLKQAA